MILCLDVGNSQIFAGLFENGKCIFRFRKSSVAQSSSDELGIFLRTVLRESDFDPKSIEQIALCTVVPNLMHSLRNACMKYLDLDPFILQAGVKTGLKIKTSNPAEIGSDRIANAIGAITRYPGENLIVVDFGTATSFDAISAEKEYHGAVIVPGLRISMEALEMKTAKLPSVEIVKAERALGRSTTEAIQAGLYFGGMGAVKELVARITAECFPGKPPKVLATGGIARLFEDSGIFVEFLPDLVLEGLHTALLLNIDR